MDGSGTVSALGVGAGGRDTAWPPFEGLLLKQRDDPVQFARYTNDWEDIQQAVSHCSAHRISITTRGRGHSIEGQSCSHGGLIVDMKSFNKVLEVTDSFIELEGGASFIDIMKVTIPANKMPILLPESLGLSTAGFVSVGGITSSAFKYGLVLNAASALTVITMTGDMIRCDVATESEMFGAVLGGLGQFGIIVAIRFPLVPIPDRQITTDLLYHDIESYFSDMRKVISHPSRWDAMLAGLHPNRSLEETDESSATKWLYQMHLRLVPGPGVVATQAITAALADFQDRDSRAPNRSTKISSYYGALSAKLRQAIAQEKADEVNPFIPPPQIWLAFFLPSTAPSISFVKDWLSRLDPSIWETVCVELLPRDQLAKHSFSFTVPDMNELIFVYLTTDIESPEKKTQVTASRDVLWHEAQQHGAKVFPFVMPHRCPSAWVAHFGAAKYEQLRTLKHRCDPSRLLNPSQCIFEPM